MPLEKKIHKNFNIFIRAPRMHKKIFLIKKQKIKINIFNKPWFNKLYKNRTSLALMGMPFLTGFYSKDVILEVGYATYSTASHFAYWLGSFAAFCTAFYSIRLLALCFLVEPNGSRSLLLSASEGKSKANTKYSNKTRSPTPKKTTKKPWHNRT